MVAGWPRVDSQHILSADFVAVDIFFRVAVAPPVVAAAVAAGFIFEGNSHPAPDRRTHPRTDRCASRHE